MFRCRVQCDCAVPLPSALHGYAKPLAEKLGYVNTFYHAEPRLDIANVPDEMLGRYDFLGVGCIQRKVVSGLKAPPQIPVVY